MPEGFLSRRVAGAAFCLAVLLVLLLYQLRLSEVQVLEPKVVDTANHVLTKEERRAASELPLVSPRDIYLITLFSAEHARVYVEHFMTHYLKLGLKASNFLVMINHPTYDEVLFDEMMRAFRRFGVTHFLLWDGTYNSCNRCQKEVMWLHELGLTNSSRWIVPMDADELLQLPSKYSRFDQWATVIQRSGYTAASALFLDRFARSGELVPIRPSPSLDEQFPMGCRFTRRVAHAYDFKVVLHRADFRATTGHHNVGTDPLYFNRNQNTRKGYCSGILNSHLVPQPESPFVMSRSKLQLHHFKWDSLTLEKLKKRVKDVTAAGATHADESVLVKQHLDQHHGFVCVWCEELQCKMVNGTLSRSRKKE